MTYRTKAVLSQENLFDQAYGILKEKKYFLYTQFVEKVKKDDFGGFFGERRRRSLKEDFIKDFLKPFSSELGIQGEPDKFYDNFCEFLITEIKPAFQIVELEDRFVIHGVMYRDAVRVIELKKEFLDKGQFRPQDEWIAYSKNALNKNDFVVGSAPLYHAIFTALYRNRNDAQYHELVEKARAQIKKLFAPRWVCTLSRVTYMPVGSLDVVTHDVGMPDQYTVPTEVVGPNEFLKELKKNREAIKALLLHDDLKEINDVYLWISGYDAYLWCLDSKPQQKAERVVALGVDNVSRFYLLAVDDIVYDGPSLGVRVAKNFSAGNEGSVQ